MTSQAELEVNILNERRIYWLVDEFGASPNTEPFPSYWHAIGYRKIWEARSGCEFKIRSKWLGVYDEEEEEYDIIFKWLHSLVEPPKAIEPVVEIDAQESEF